MALGPLRGMPALPIPLWFTQHLHILQPQQKQIHRGCSLNIGNIVIITYVMQQFALLGFDKNADPIQKYNISYYAEQIFC